RVAGGVVVGLWRRSLRSAEKRASLLLSLGRSGGENAGDRDSQQPPEGPPTALLSDHHVASPQSMVPCCSLPQVLRRFGRNSRSLSRNGQSQKRQDGRAGVHDTLCKAELSLL